MCESGSWELPTRKEVRILYHYRNSTFEITSAFSQYTNYQLPTHASCNGDRIADTNGHCRCCPENFTTPGLETSCLATDG